MNTNALFYNFWTLNQLNGLCSQQKFQTSVFKNYEYFSISDKSNEINKIYDDIALNSEGLTMNYKWDYYGITNEVEKDLELDKREYYYVDCGTAWEIVISHLCKSPIS